MKLKLKSTAIFLLIIMIFSGTNFTANAEEVQKNPNWFEHYDSELASISFSMSEIEIAQSNYHMLTVFSNTGKTVNLEVNFGSSNSEIVSVDNLGRIYANSKGTAEITATLKGNTSIIAHCAVKVVSGEPQKSTSLSLSSSSASLYIGNRYALTAVSNYPVEWSSSDPDIANVSNGVVTAVSSGHTVITADNGYNKTVCSVTVTGGNSVNISSYNYTMPAGKTLYLSSTTTGAVWKSTNTDIATVQQVTDVYGNEIAFILAKKSGIVSITASTSSGAADCLLTITESEPIRYTYTTPNSIPAGNSADFIAITDLERTDVKFEYTLNGASGTVNADSRIVEGNTAVWTASVPLSSVGTYEVRAYSKTNETDFKSCSDGKTTAYVIAASNPKETTCEPRRMSNEVIPMFAAWEGFRPNVELDNITGSDPTIGYGRVVTVGSTFYNSITEREATAYLYETVNAQGYADAVNEFLIGNGIRFNQQQFDSLVCFVYNFGIYALDYYESVHDILINTGPPAIPKLGNSGKINGTEVRLRTAPSIESDDTIITEMDIGTRITLISEERYNPDNEFCWYYIQLDDGRKGYVYSKYITFDSLSGGNRDLNNIDKQQYIQTIMQYHHAENGNGELECYWGLVYRRVDELELFFEGDYIQDGRSNKYGYKYSCWRDSSVYIG